MYNRKLFFVFVFFLTVMEAGRPRPRLSTDSWRPYVVSEEELWVGKKFFQSQGLEAFITCGL